MLGLNPAQCCILYNLVIWFVVPVSWLVTMWKLIMGWNEWGDTAWKVPKYGVSSGPYIPVTRIYGPEKLRIWTLFTH